LMQLVRLVVKITSPVCYFNLNSFEAMLLSTAEPEL